LYQLISGAEASEEDGDLHRIETEEPKVKIMTIHASKGLEFPIVFIAGGLSVLNKNELLKYHNINGNIVFALNGEGLENFKREELQENERLFYVALTRTVYKLYCLSFNPPRKYSPGFAVSQLSPRLSYLLETNHSEIGEIKYLVNDKHMTGNTESFSAAYNCNQEGFSIIDNNIINKIMNFNCDDYRRRTLSVSSFTSIKNSILKLNNNPEYSKSSMFEYNEFRYVEDESEELTKEFEKILLTGQQRNITEETQKRILPGGAETGTILHSIFEKIEFAKISEFSHFHQIAKNKECNKIISTVFNEHNFLDFEFEVIDKIKYGIRFLEVCKIIFNTLKSPIIDDFSLSNLNRNKRLSETEFYFPLSRKAADQFSDSIFPTCFFTGSIDLIFQYNKKYYFADWKSNIILPDYSINSLNENMHSEHYILQSKIYTIAVLRWLAVTIYDFNFERDFGGIFYFYLRGMNAVSGETGIYFYRPENVDKIIDYEKEIVCLKK